MEWTAPVNDILSDKITKLNYTLIPPSFQGDVRSVRVMQESLSKVIDALGEQSTAAQGLSKVITTADKLRNTPTHILYLMKDPSANGGKGEVIGLLKVGRKHLFLFDEQDKVREVEPLCVLDFYIQQDRQRHGFGKILFDYMLQDNNAAAKDLAIDGPSQKMEQFLRKSYGIERLIRQNNNFAVAPEFFSTNTNMSSGRSTPAVTPAAVGRFAAPKPHSSIANVIHGGAKPNIGVFKNTPNGHASHAASPEHERRRAPRREPEPEVPEPEPEVPEPEPEEAHEGEEPEKISPERPSTLSVEPIAEAEPGAPSPAGSTMSRRDSQLTDRGYFDVKFYHNKLW
ncbi:alpha-tubulin N-acetyltransferase 1-like [Aricia agestis]|uniref:alpha-tubulin N-acetyltransferase 1-like n=1 Tax=Aricia agestis TaxID=91739 RepID=UPI001C2045B4|nr:alpha-tubulin N-acetyltransferase 1-like [Aricia agestis]